MNEKVKQEIDNIVRTLTSTGTVSQIYLFGSYARGEETPDSDIDLCVLTSIKKRPIELTAEYTYIIWNVTTTPLDLLAFNKDMFFDHINKHPKSFEHEIVEKGVLLYDHE